ncbi:MAG: Gfo/Idh/MocA family oxidoreductase [Gemmatimonadetes bacterium]|nr:Gfo/Idh/MocA family oxidoreductase [Gemmatimonadota bacterium]
MTEKLRVAVAGASGIGKHHAKWYHGADCEVIGFLGSGPDSCEQTAQTLRGLFPFAGKGYWNWEQLLEEARPDIVDICTPNELHDELAFRGLEAGCHVLCEKPLLWQWDTPSTELLARASDVVAVAREKSLHFGVCTQYAMALPHYAQLYESARGVLGRIDSFYTEMETLARGRQRSAAEIWIDMGPHPLSLLQAWIPDGVIDGGSLRVEFEGRGATTRFDFIAPQGSCSCEIAVRDRDEGSPVRRFGVNGLIVDCGGRADAEGVYRSVLSLGDEEVLGEDFMSLLIGCFVEAVRTPGAALPVSGEVGLRNLELLIQVLEQARA